MAFNADYTVFKRQNLIINGDYNEIRGDNCVVNGDYNLVTGDYCVINGDYNKVSGANCIFNGDNNRRLKKREILHPVAEKEYVEGPIPFEIEHDEQQDNKDSATCIICLDNKPCCIALPCMHKKYCVKCARILCFGEDGTGLREIGAVECSECKKKITSIKRVFE